MTGLRQLPNVPEQNIAKYLSKKPSLIRTLNNRNKDHSREEHHKTNQQVRKEKKIVYVGNLHETVTDSDLGKLFGLRTKNYLIHNGFIEMSKLRGVSCSSLKLIFSYFSNCNHRTKIKGCLGTD